jgi:archaellum component FlaF (FlaF/FlaG flagellin family)
VCMCVCVCVCVCVFVCMCVVRDAKELERMEEVTNPRRSRCGTQYTAHNTTYNIQHTTYNIQHTTYNIKHTACRANMDVENACLLTPVQESAQLVGC